ncbi:MAG: hypothetical protein NTW36_03070 [Planctomycetia bacterium]|nr:hypothetical protein [Planctomycetia bacterium]
MSHKVAYRRRGMLMLMVMLMLALFMAIGAMLLTIAARARAAARANFAATQQSALSDAPLRDALDEALMATLRGAMTGTDGSVQITSATTHFRENLLADKYGLSITGSGVIATGTGNTVMTLSLTGTALTSGTASRLNGRVLTIKPRPGDGDMASYRILGASGTTSPTTCYVAQMPSVVSRQLPTGSFEVIINGREFTPVTGTSTNESYDAYDNENLWLAQPVITIGQVSGTFPRMSFVGTSGSAAVDNDNDGVLDGVWIPSAITSGSATPAPYVIPDQPSPLGGTLRFQVSYLILDLDGRINVNTAGISGTTGGSYASTSNATLGMGYGPADVDVSLLFPPTSPDPAGTSTFTSAGTGVWSSLVFGGVPSVSGTLAPSLTQRRPPPLLGSIQGRYGPDGKPGVANVNDADAYQTITGTATYAATVTGSSTVADLQGRLKVYMGGSSAAPKQIFFSPVAWSAAADMLDDPYELRLDQGASRWGVPRRPSPATSSISDDNPFTLSELERVLRPNDGDAIQLPQRLAAGVGDFAQRARMLITTDSWDTPGITGDTGRTLEDFIAGLPPMTPSLWSTGSTSVSPETAAGRQFNINRPVLSGTSTAAVEDQQEYCKALYSVARALGASAANAAQWATNVLDFRDADSVLTRFQYDTNPGNGWQASDFATQPAWGMERPEVVIKSGSFNATTGNVDVTLFRPYSQVELQIGAGSPTNIEPIAAALGNSPSTLVFRSTPVIWRLRQEAGPTTTIADDSTLAVGQQRLVSFAASGITKVFLERLANPSLAFDATTNPYVPVDETSLSGAVLLPSWFHWPNRPFISHGELLLVGGTYASRGPSPSSLPLTIPGILDATCVPSRFAGNSVTISGSTSNLNLVGLDRLATNQLSKWREPGKVNVNTIVSSTNPAVDLDDVVWTTLISSTSPANPFSTTPAKSIGWLLTSTPIVTGTFGDLRDDNPFFTRARAIRLANTATVRSNVFAIWITVKVTDDSPNAPSPVTKRLFAIIDRSIPVGFSPNQDLNVRDTIRLKRYLD